MKTLGIILVVLGVLALVYQGIQYTSREKILDLGSLEVMGNTKKNIPLPPIVGGISLIVGIVLILVDRKKK